MQRRETKGGKNHARGKSRKRSTWHHRESKRGKVVLPGADSEKDSANKWEGEERGPGGQRGGPEAPWNGPIRSKNSCEEVSC